MMNVPRVICIVNVSTIEKIEGERDWEMEIDAPGKEITVKRICY